MCLDFFPGCHTGGHHCTHNASILTCVYTTGVGMFHRPLLKAATHHDCTQHVQQSTDMSIQLPAGLQCDPVQMAELRQQVQDAWDNLLRDDIRYLYDRLHARIHAYVYSSGGDALCNNMIVCAPLIVTCVFHLV